MDEHAPGVGVRAEVLEGRHLLGLLPDLARLDRKGELGDDRLHEGIEQARDDAALGPGEDRVAGVLDGVVARRSRGGGPREDEVAGGARRRGVPDQPALLAVAEEPVDEEGPHEAVEEPVRVHLGDLAQRELGVAAERAGEAVGDRAEARRQRFPDPRDPVGRPGPRLREVTERHDGDARAAIVRAAGDCVERSASGSRSIVVCSFASGVASLGDDVAGEHAANPAHHADVDLAFEGLVEGGDVDVDLGAVLGLDEEVVLGPVELDLGAAVELQGALPRVHPQDVLVERPAEGAVEVLAVTELQARRGSGSYGVGVSPRCTGKRTGSATSSSAAAKASRDAAAMTSSIRKREIVYIIACRSDFS